MMFDFLKRKPKAQPTPVQEQKFWLSPEFFDKPPTSAQADTWDTETAITDGYQASTITYACIEKRATSCASVPFVAKRKQGDEYVAVPDSELQLLINKPNPNQGWAELLEAAIQHLDLAGNAYMHMVRAGKNSAPMELWLLDPRYIKIKATDKDRIISGYEFQSANASKVFIPWEDMVHLKYQNPSSSLYGISPMMATGRAIDTDKQAGIWQKSSLTNRGVSDYAVVLDKDTTKTQFDAIKALHTASNAGNENARKVLFTSRDVKTLNMTAVELDFSNSRQKVWEEICAGFGVPPAMVGLYENATLANIETARKIFWRDTIIPLLDKITSQLNAQLAAEFGEEWVIEYDDSNIDALKEGLESRLNNAQKLFAMGVPLSVLNTLFELNIPEDASYDAAYVQSGYIPVSMLGQVDATAPVADESTTTAVAGTEVAKTALNGAQITALQGIVMSVALGELPYEAALQLIINGFPAIGEDAAKSILDSVKNFTPATAEPTQDQAVKAALLAYGIK
jgi:HK97 family phage portal protein